MLVVVKISICFVHCLRCTELLERWTYHSLLTNHTIATSSNHSQITTNNRSRLHNYFSIEHNVL